MPKKPIAKKLKEYDHTHIERAWQKQWDASGLYTVPDALPGKENYYTLVEFSYPSGNLHVGHWYAFAVQDIFARYKRMEGCNVLYPMGFDAFGLPAENAAIKEGADPKTWTYERMEKMRGQLRSMGASFDWSREVVTCDPEYYKWTQWMFNEFFKKDLAYRATTQVNWCPKDKTILANEQVVGGNCERCGTPVTQKDQDQWLFRITKYADRLVDDLDKLDWPESIKESQKNWIGRNEGSEIEFQITDGTEKIKVFTTRADTLFGVTYIVLAPEHPLVQTLKEKATNTAEIDAYVEQTKGKLELERQQSKEKTGVELKGITAINPANNESVPVWIADYVLAQYGTGAVMAVPAHDERDFEFAEAHNLITSKQVISALVESQEISPNEKPKNIMERMSKHAGIDLPYVQDGFLIDSGEFSDLESAEARKKITEKVGGKFVKTYRLRDWGISRQRYWGVPIPIVYDPEGKAHPIPVEHLPWLLPEDVDHTPDGTAPLARSKELFERTEKIFGIGWRPEVETMDTFVDSSWYFYRYLDNHNKNEFSARTKMDSWMPIDLYMGGAEHTTMHLLYSRFWTKALYDLGYVADDEAYTVRRNRGIILGPDGEKMSKSRGNVIAPDEIVERLGADTVRMYLAFMGPYGVPANYPWDPNGVVGVRRFLERTWRLFDRIGDAASTQDILFNQTIAGVGEDIREFKFNTAISKMMILLNAWEKEDSISEEEYSAFLKLLAPFAPHMTEELWHELDNVDSMHLAEWPSYDTSKLVSDTVTIAIQINGKLRGDITVSRTLEKEEVEKQALAHEKVVMHLDGALPKRIIYVPGRLINIVV